MELAPARPGRAVGAGAGRLFYSTFDVIYVFPTLRSHKSARAAVQVTTYGRKPRPAVAVSGHYSSRGPAGYRYMPTSGHYS